MSVAKRSASERWYKGYETWCERNERVAQNIAPEHRALWDRMKSKIGGSSPESRQLEFEQYVHENPDAVVEALQDEADRKLHELLKGNEMEDAHEGA